MNKATKYTVLTIVVGIILFAALTKVADCVPQKPAIEITPEQKIKLFRTRIDSTRRAIRRMDSTVNEIENRLNDAQ